MSASSRPTRAPEVCSDAARLTATVDLPTPPLPDATAMMCFTPGIAPVRAPPLKGLRTLAVIRRSTAVTPGIPLTRSCASAWKRSRTGHAGVVSSNVKLTVPSPEIARSLIMPRLTTSRPRSGSLIAARTASTSSLLGTEDHRGAQCKHTHKHQERDHDGVQTYPRQGGRSAGHHHAHVAARAHQPRRDTRHRKRPESKPGQHSWQGAGGSHRHEEHDDQCQLERREVAGRLVQPGQAEGSFRTVAHEQPDERCRAAQARGEKKAAERPRVAPYRLVADAEQHPRIGGDEDPEHRTDDVENAIQERRHEGASPAIAQPRLGRRNEREETE